MMDGQERLEPPVFLFLASVMLRSLFAAQHTEGRPVTSNASLELSVLVLGRV